MIPVIWASWHPEVPGRPFWDQALLQDLFDGKVWTPPGFPGFQHHDVHRHDLPDLDGAVVVLPGRYHAGMEDEISKQIGRYRWVLLIITSDEESWFDWGKVVHPNMTLWVMTPHPSHARKYPGQATRFLGEGYQPGTPALAAARLPEMDRPLHWAFLGQITHRRRQELAQVLRDRRDGHLLASHTFAGGVNQESYMAWLTQAKVAPAPSGPVTLDSFRLYEAFEAGCIPVVEMSNGTGERYGDDFWPLLFGDRHDLFSAVEHWAQFPEVLNLLLEGWPMNQVRSTAGWLAYKRDLATQLVQETWRGHDLESYATEDRLTVVIPTSPIQLHPSTHIIDATIQSIRDRLPRAEIIIACDGVRPEQEAYRPGYEEYLRRLTWKCLHEWENVLPLIAREHIHQANLARLALEQVHTPAVLFVEHDTPLIGDIPFTNLVDAVLSEDAQMIRLHHEAGILEPHRHLMLDDTPQDLHGAPALRTVQWSQRPHVANTAFYRDTINHFFGQDSRTMIEDVMHGVLDHHWRLYGDKGWEKFQVWIYAPEGDMKRSDHTDGRRRSDGELDPKYEEGFVYAYDGNTPDGAPAPTADRIPE